MVEKKPVIAVFPGAKEKSILGRLHKLTYDRGSAIVEYTPFKTEKSSSKMVKDGKIEVKTVYMPQEKKKRELPVENVDDKPDVLELFIHPTQDILCFQPEEFLHLGEFPKYNELKEEHMGLKATMNRYHQVHQGLVEMNENNKNQINQMHVEMALARYQMAGFTELLKGVESEVINSRQSNITLVATVEAMLRSTVGDRTLIKNVTDLMDKQGEMAVALGDRIVEYRKQILETPDLDRMIEYVEQEKKRDVERDEEMKGKLQDLDEAISDLKRTQHKAPPQQPQQQTRPAPQPQAPQSESDISSTLEGLLGPTKPEKKPVQKPAKKQQGGESGTDSGETEPANE